MFMLYNVYLRLRLFHSNVLEEVKDKCKLCKVESKALLA